MIDIAQLYKPRPAHPPLLTVPVTVLWTLARYLPFAPVYSRSFFLYDRLRLQYRSHLRGKLSCLPLSPLGLRIGLAFQFVSFTFETLLVGILVVTYSIALCILLIRNRARWSTASFIASTAMLLLALAVCGLILESELY